MKIKITESEFNDYFKYELSDGMCSHDDIILNESISTSDKSELKILIRKEIKDFLDINRSSDLERKIGDIIKRKFKNDKDIEKYIVDITRNVLVQLYKNLYTRKNFWANDLKNSSN